jgi:hypothetical protein
MPKTQFENGTIVTPEFLNSINNHVHDGEAKDGSAPKITLGAHTQGLLPSTQQGRHSHSGFDGQNKINLGTDVEGILPMSRVEAHNHGISEFIKMAEPFTGSINFYRWTLPNGMSIVSVFAGQHGFVAPARIEFFLYIFQELPQMFRPAHEQYVPITIIGATEPHRVARWVPDTGQLSIPLDSVITAGRDVHIAAFTYQYMAQYVA